MIKTVSLVAVLAALAFSPAAASARTMELSLGGGGHDDRQSDAEHRRSAADRYMVEDTHSDHGGGHAEERHETSHESSHGDKDHH